MNIHLSIYQSLVKVDNKTIRTTKCGTWLESGWSAGSSPEFRFNPTSICLGQSVANCRYKQIISLSTVVLNSRDW